MLDDLLDRIRSELGLEIPELEYGPGFPAVYFDGETFDEDAYMAEFSALLCGMRNKLPVMLELGRGIAASCGSMLTRVADLKRNHSGHYAILDSGIHHLTYYGQFMAMKHPLCELYPPREASPDDPVWNLCGSLCTINDLLVKKLPLHDLKAGDLLIFRNTGAYSMTEGISLFLSRDLPAVWLLYADGRLIKVREDTETYRWNCPQ
jgi:diaminopimelate decarboxylase